MDFVHGYVLLLLALNVFGWGLAALVVYINKRSENNNGRS